VNGLLRSWNLIDDGPTFEIISERDTCCQCELFFNNTREFAYHFRDHHEGQSALTKLDPGHNQFCIFETGMPRGGEKAGHDEASIVIPLPYAFPEVLKEEAAIEPIVDDQLAPLLDNWDYDSDDESDFYYPSSQVDLDSGDESLLSQSNIDFVDQLVSDDSDIVFNGIFDFADKFTSDDDDDEFDIDDTDDTLNGIQDMLLADNSFDSDLEDSILLLDSNVGDSDTEDDIPLLRLYNDGGLILYSAEDLSDEVDIMDTSIEIAAEIVHATLDDGLAIPEEEIVAGPSRVSNKRKVENRVSVVSNKKPRTNYFSPCYNTLCPF
jgi:hypothetical protein